MYIKNAIAMSVLVAVSTGCSWPGQDTSRGSHDIPVTKPQMSVAPEPLKPASAPKDAVKPAQPASKPAVTVAEVPPRPAPLSEKSERSAQATSATAPATSATTSTAPASVSQTPAIPRGADPRLAPRGGQNGTDNQQPVSLAELVPGIQAGSNVAPAVAAPARDKDVTSPASRPIGEDLVNDSVLQVNKEYVTVDGIVRSASEKLAAITKGIGQDRFRQRAKEILTDEIRRQISELLVMTEASNRIDDDQKKRVETEVEQAERFLITQLGGGSKVKLEQVLIDQGTTLTTVLNDHRRRLTVRLFLHDKFMPEIKITRQMLWDYYTKHASDFSQTPKVQMQIISEPASAFLPEGVRSPSKVELQDARASAREAIEKARTQLQAGKDFGEVAMAFSKDAKAVDGGVWPMMSKGSFREEKVETAAFALPAGGISDIIETDSGFYIVKARQIQQAKTVSFEDAQQKIEVELRTQQEHTLTDAFFDKLMEGSVIIEYAKFIDLAVDRATEKFFKKQ